MSPPISSIAQRLTGSSVVDSRRKADELAARGIKIVDFGAGEPYFDAPAAVAEAGIRAIEAGKGHYIDPRGLPSLREAIARYESGPDRTVAPDAVVVTTGSFGAISIAARALLDAGDEVLLLEPFWGPYRNIVQLVGAVPIAVPASGAALAVDAEVLERHVTARTRAIVINSPNNPSGRVLTREELGIVAALAERYDLWIIADEVYRELVFGGARHLSIAALGPTVAGRTVVVSSLSKSFAMTGWRLGYCVAPAAVTEIMARINHYTVRCPTSFVQYAAVTALNDAWQDVAAMREAYARRRALVIERLARLEGIRLMPPQGTFYAFPEVPAAWGNGKSVADRLLNQAGVIVSAGSAYGPSTAQHIRLSFATSEETLREGFDRIEQWVAVNIREEQHAGS